MSQARSASIMLSGVVFLSFIYFLSLVISMIFSEIFGIQDNNIWKVIVVTFFGIIGIFIYLTEREKYSWAKYCKKLHAEQASLSSKSNIICQARYFSDSRKEIAADKSRKNSRYKNDKK